MKRGIPVKKDERIKELLTALRLCLPIIEAEAKASHLMDGFRPRRNKNDDILDAVKKALGDIL
jgi:predicted RNase H-like nuclease